MNIEFPQMNGVEAYTCLTNLHENIVEAEKDYNQTKNRAFSDPTISDSLLQMAYNLHMKRYIFVASYINQSLAATEDESKEIVAPSEVHLLMLEANIHDMSQKLSLDLDEIKNCGHEFAQDHRIKITMIQKSIPKLLETEPENRVCITNAIYYTYKYQN